MNNNGILKQNEIESNKFAAKTMLLTNLFVILVYVLDVVGIFVADLTKMTIACGLAIVLLTLPAFIVLLLKRHDAWVKYVIATLSVLMVSIITALLQFHAVIMYLYPVAIASLYFSRKLSWYTVGFSLVFLNAAQIASLYVGIGDKNFTILYDTVVYGVGPRTITYLAVSVIFILLSKRTGQMLNNIMGAEEQAAMLERMRAVTAKSMEVSNILVNSVSELSAVTEDTAKSNENIAANTQKIAVGSSETMVFMDEASQAVVDISQNLNRIANEGKLIAEISSQVQKMTEENGMVMKGAVSEMNSIADAANESKEIVERLENRSAEIGRIVEVITDISEQTNMLALNAAIESARAGEQGRGFAVVASQIRTLAEQSQRAAKDIENLISQVMKDTSKAVEAMDRSSVLVNKGVGVLRDAGVSFEKVSSAGLQMNSKVQEVSNATMDVAKSSGRIVDIVSSIKNINTKSLNDLKEIASASEQQLCSMEQVASSVMNIENISKELYEAVKEK